MKSWDFSKRPQKCRKKVEIAVGNFSSVSNSGAHEEYPFYGTYLPSIVLGTRL